MFKKAIYTIGLFAAAALLSGCEMALFDPKGPVAEEARTLILVAFGLMLIIIIPVLFMTVYFPWKYRSSNEGNDYKPNWEHSTQIEIIVWLVPCLIILALGTVTYMTSHSMDPREPLNDEDPLTIQVVALDWKWLFIYPEEQVATVNEIAIPVDRPVEFLITSDTVMNSFFIPQLGSQIYAMAGMENRLNLMASEEGVFRGMSANYSGFGFSGMKFKVHSLPTEGYDGWINKVKRSQLTLDEVSYEILSHKTKDHAVQYFSDVDPLHFNKTIEKYTGEQNGE